MYQLVLAVYFLLFRFKGREISRGAKKCGEVVVSSTPKMCIIITYSRDEDTRLELSN